MKVVFMGTPEFSVPILRALVENGYEVAGVFTQPDKPKGRGGKVQMTPVKEYALSQNIPVFQPLKIRKDGLDDLKSLAPDLCVTAAFGQILSQEVLDVPKIGTVNVHTSLLPRHRGAAPVQWTVWQGETVTGVTTMFTDAGIDTGDILLQRETPIGPEETAGELTERLSHLGGELLIETLRRIEAGAVFVPANVTALRRISWCCAGAAVVCLAAAYIYLPFAFLGVAAAFMALIVRVLKNAFAQAVHMKDELDYTI